MVKCIYCMREDAAYEVEVDTRVAGKDYNFLAKVCIKCMPVDKYVMKEYKCL